MKRTIKRLLSVVLCFVLVFSICPVAVFASDEDAGATDASCEHINYHYVTTVQATTEQEGKMVKECLDCGIQEEIAEDGGIIAVGGCNHLYYSWVTIQASTCAVTGYAHKICNVCRATLGYRTVETHNFSMIYYQAATCVAEGQILYFCVDCFMGKTEILPVDSENHYYSEWTVLKEATCKDTGLKERYCYRVDCNAVETQEIPVDENGHTYDETTVFTVTKAPTCEETGIEEFECTTCGETATREMPRHYYTLQLYEDGINYDATCSGDGIRSLICKDTIVNGEVIKGCGYITTEVIPADSKTHTYEGKWVTVEDATATEHGVQYQSCKYCATLNEDNPQPVHNYETILASDTCGITNLGCTVEDCAETTSVETKGTHIALKWYDATGKEKIDCSVATGVKQYCDGCDKDHKNVIATKMAAAGSHPNVQNYTVLQKPTCEYVGIVKGDCPDCNKTNVTAYISALGHADPGVWTITKKPQCHPVLFSNGDVNESVSYDDCKGYKEKFCGRCGETIKGEAIDAYIHEFVILIAGTPATCTTDGITDHQYCTFCNVYVPQKTISATGHDFVDQIVDGETAAKFCVNCNEYKIVTDGGDYITCNCLCHNSNGIGKLFFNFLRFFYKLFGINQECKCGELHYDDAGLF